MTSETKEALQNLRRQNGHLAKNYLGGVLSKLFFIDRDIDKNPSLAKHTLFVTQLKISLYIATTIAVQVVENLGKFPKEPAKIWLEHVLRVILEITREEHVQYKTLVYDSATSILEASKALADGRTQTDALECFSNDYVAIIATCLWGPVGNIRGFGLDKPELIRVAWEIIDHDSSLELRVQSVCEEQIKAETDEVCETTEVHVANELFGPNGIGVAQVTHHHNQSQKIDKRKFINTRGFSLIIQTEDSL